MTLDEYRLQMFEKLKACSQVPQVRELLSEVHTMLASARMSDSSQKAFWQSLNHDLNVLVHESQKLPQQSGASMSRTVIATAQAAIAQYQRRLTSDT
jgi:hypothetical protein